MDFAFKFAINVKVSFINGPDVSGIVIGLFVDRCRKARVLVELWNKNNMRYHEYFDEDELKELPAGS